MTMTPETLKARRAMLVKALSDRFSRLIRRELTDGEFEHLVQESKDNDDPRVCCSHDYLDANETMAAAFKSTMKREIDLDDLADVALWNAAWDMSKSKLFGN